MSPSEKVALGAALEELERPKAEARKRNLPGDTTRETFPSSDSSAGKVCDLVGEAVGMSGTTYKRAKSVVQMADDGVTVPAPGQPPRPLTDDERQTARKASLAIPCWRNSPMD